MSHKGCCYDNSPTERFFRSLKHEQLFYEKFNNKEAAKLSIIDYVAFYNGNVLTLNWVIIPRYNMSVFSGERLFNKLSGFCEALQGGLVQ